MAEYQGVCDLCGKEADAAAEDCHSVTCTSGCNRPDIGDIYHSDCLKKYIAQGSKGTAKHLPNIPYSKFHCPKGKGKGTSAEAPCKGMVDHCRRLIVRAEPKAPPPVQVLQRQPKPKPAAKPAGPPKPPKPKVPQITDFNPRIRQMPMPAVPKADPLGRNLNGKAQAELPPGWVEESQEAADKAKAGKAAKKNQKRAAKRKEESGSAGLGDASSTNGSVTDGSGMPLTEDVLGAAAWQSGSGGGGEEGGEEGSVTSGTRFITDYSAYVSLLSKHMELSDDEYEHEEPPGPPQHTARHSTAGIPVPQWAQQQEEEDSGGGVGWQAVGSRGRAAAPAAPPAGEATWNSGQQGQGQGQTGQTGQNTDVLQQREEALLRAALEASLADQAPAAGAQAAAAGGDEADFEAALARAMQESLAAQAAREQQEREEQEALLAALERQRQQQQQQHQQEQQATVSGWDTGTYQQQPQQQQQPAHSGAYDGWGGIPAPAAADAAGGGDAWGSAGSADSASTAWDALQHSTPQHSTPYSQHQHQQQGTASSYGTYPFPQAAAAPAAPAAAAASPQYITYALPQQAATPAPAPLTPAGAPFPTTSTPTTAPYQQQQQAAVSYQQQQQRAPAVPWLQPAAAAGSYTPAPAAAAGAAAGAAMGSYTPAPAAAAVADEDDGDEDLDTLMAILGV